MQLFIATLSFYVGVLIAILAVVLLVRDVGGRRTRLFSRRGLGALCILLAGCLLTTGGRDERIRTLNKERATFTEAMLSLQQPLDALTVHVYGPDLFRSFPNSCSVRLQITLASGLAIVSEVPPQQLRAAGAASEGFRGYTIPWSSIVNGTTTPEGRTAAEGIRQIGDFFNVSSLQPMLETRNSHRGQEAKSLELLIGATFPIVVFSGGKDSDEEAQQDGRWVTQYTDSGFSSGDEVFHGTNTSYDRMHFWKVVQALPLHTLTMALFRILAGGLILMALGISLRGPGWGHGRSANSSWFLGPRPRNDLTSSMFSFWDRVGSNYVLVFTALALALVGAFLGEKIAVGDGLGFDGILYGGWAASFYHTVIENGLNGYYIQRILPSAIVHYSLRLLAVPLTTENVIRGFGLLNTAMIGLAAYTWCRIAEELGIGMRGKWLGFVGLFLNYAVLKWPSYYPILTDTTAFALSLLMLYSYLIRNQFALCIMTGLGVFVWPTLLFEGALFLLFPRDLVSNKAWRPAPWGGNVVLAWVGAVATYLFIGYQVLIGPVMQLQRNVVFLSKVLDFVGLPSGGISNERMDVFELAGLSGVISAIYIFFGLKNLWNYKAFFDLGQLLKWFTGRAFLSGLIFVCGLKFLVTSCAKYPTPNEWWGALGTMGTLAQTVSDGIRWPGLFYVAHVIYFGPILLLVIFQWPFICRLMHRDGLGVILVATFGLLMSLSSQSRIVVNFFPIIIAYAVLAIEHVPRRAFCYWLLALVSLAFSKAWLVIGLKPEDDWSAIEQFPVQRYYMSIGPCMSWQMYCVQGAFVLLAAFGLYGLFFLNVFTKSKK